MKRLEKIIQSTTEPNLADVMWLDTSNPNNPILKSQINGEWKATSESSGKPYKLSSLPTADMTTQSQLDTIGLTMDVVDAAINGDIDTFKINQNNYSIILANQDDSDKTLQFECSAQASDDSLIVVDYHLKYTKSSGAWQVKTFATQISSQKQADWGQTNSAQPDYIKHKPLQAYQAGDYKGHPFVPILFDLTGLDVTNHPEDITKESISYRGVTYQNFRSIISNGYPAFVALSTSGSSVYVDRFLPLTAGTADFMDNKFSLIAIDISYDATTQKLKGTQYTFTAASNPMDATPPVQVDTFEI